MDWSALSRSRWRGEKGECEKERGEKGEGEKRGAGMGSRRVVRERGARDRPGRRRM